jgi:hypothetical protein
VLCIVAENYRPRSERRELEARKMLTKLLLMH